MSNQFTLTHDDGSAKVEYTFSAVDLDTVLENVDRFIKAAGFLPKGRLEYVDEDDQLLNHVFLIRDSKYNYDDAGIFTDEKEVRDAVKFMNEETEKGRFDYVTITELNQSHYKI